MNFEVINRELCIGSIRISAVASSSILMIGDANSIQSTSMFDTPAESLVLTPSVPLAPQT